MLTLTPTNCRVNDMWIQETLAQAERRAALQLDAPETRRNSSRMSRLALPIARPIARPIQALGLRRLLRSGLVVSPRL